MKTIKLSKSQEERYCKRAKRIVNSLNIKAERIGKKGIKRLFKSCAFINDIVAKKIAAGLRKLGYEVVEDTSDGLGYDMNVIYTLIISWK